MKLIEIRSKIFSKKIERRCKQNVWKQFFLSPKGYFVLLEYLETPHFFYRQACSERFKGLFITMLFHFLMCRDLGKSVSNNKT